MGRRRHSKIEKAMTKANKGIEELYIAVCERVKEMQEANGKGYVETQDINRIKTPIRFIAYNDKTGGEMTEGKVCGVRAVRNGSGLDLQVVGTASDAIVFDNDSFADCNESYGTRTPVYNYDGFDGDWESSWQYIKDHDYIMYEDTLVSIAESIDQYE